ncbi:MAG: GntR family transcriptional regulator [Alphaproteobacteria bacterium]|jgi:GntR family transcriptional regulator|nr:GntR family transcriptional regulator [Alphaproteobacteria bacterium]
MTHAASLLDRAQPLPLYYQVYEILRAQLADGVWKAGDFLPPIPDLAARFSVSVVTIRQALDLLREDGLVLSERGRGTSVLADRADTGPLHLESTVSDLIRLYADDSPEQEPLDEGVGMPALSGAEFTLCQSYYFMKRAHIRDGMRYCLITLHIDEELFRRNETDFRQRLALPVLFENMDLKIGRAWQTLQIEKADHVVATALKVLPGDPVARVKRYITDNANRLVYCAEVHYRHDCIQYRMELKI